MDVIQIAVSNCPIAKQFFVYTEDRPNAGIERGFLVGENPVCENSIEAGTHQELLQPLVDILATSTHPEICLECRSGCKLK